MDDIEKMVGRGKWQYADHVSRMNDKSWTRLITEWKLGNGS